MDTIGVVGTGEQALGWIERVLLAGMDVVSVSPRPDVLRIALRKRTPTSRRGELDRYVRFTDDLEAVNDCSFVLDCTEGADRAARARALAALEDRMTCGAILASEHADTHGIASWLRRPAQFVGIRASSDAVHVARIEVTEATAPGVADAAHRLLTMLTTALGGSGAFAIAPAAATGTLRTG